MGEGSEHESMRHAFEVDRKACVCVCGGGSFRKLPESGELQNWQTRKKGLLTFIAQFQLPCSNLFCSKKLEKKGGNKRTFIVGEGIHAPLSQLMCSCYHLILTPPPSPPYLINSKIQSKYHRNGCKFDTPHTYIHDPLLSRLGTDTSIKKKWRW